MKGVRAELDAGADLAEPRRLLQHDRGVAGAGEAERRGQAADAAAGDQDGERGHGVTLHGVPDSVCRRRHRTCGMPYCFIATGHARGRPENALTIGRIRRPGMPCAGRVFDPAFGKIGRADRHLAVAAGQVDDIGRLGDTRQSAA